MLAPELGAVAVAAAARGPGVSLSPVRQEGSPCVSTRAGRSPFSGTPIEVDQVWSTTQLGRMRGVTGSPCRGQAAAM